MKKTGAKLGRFLGYLTYGDPTSGTELTIEAPPGRPALFFPQGSPVGARLLENLQDLGVMEKQ